VCRRGFDYAWGTVAIFLDPEREEECAELMGRLTVGTIPQREGWQRILELDPDSAAAHDSLGLEHMEAGDLPAAEAQFLQAIELSPVCSGAYLGLANCVHAREGQSALWRGLSALGWSVLESVSAVLEELAGPDERQRHKAGSGGPLSRQARAMKAQLEAELAEGPPEVTRRLLPYQLAVDICTRGNVNRATVDAVLAAASLMVAPLTGVLRDWARAELYLIALDAAVTSLALLGELAGPEATDNLLEASEADEPQLSGCAEWALTRLLERHPAEIVSRLVALAAGADGPRAQSDKWPPSRGNTTTARRSWTRYSTGLRK
jgi:tetratricopeptide (TPR) repeat protein